MEKENKKSIAKMVACFVAGIAATKVAEVCGVLAICGLTAIMLIAFIVVNIKRGETFSRKGIITLVVMILALILIGFWHLSTHLQDEFEAVEPPKTSEIVKTHDQKPEDTTTVQDIQDNSGDTGAYTPVISNPRGYCPEEEKMTTSFNNVVSNQLQGQTTTGSTINSITASDNSAEAEKQDAEIEDSKEEGATIVEDAETGITASSSTKPVVDEVKDETEKVEIDTDDAIGLESEGETTTPSEGNVDESQNTLPEASEEVTTPIEGEMTFEEEETPVVEETVTPVGVTAVDGYESYVNSQIQFKIAGDDVIIEGLDGIEYSFSDGLLTISTGTDATVLTVSISNSVSATSFDVVINGIVG